MDTNDYTPLMKAVMDDDIDSVKNNLYNIDARNSCTHTALMLAIMYKTNFEIIELLLKNGADSNLRGSPSGKTVLMLAINSHCCSREKVELLLKYGADIYLRNAIPYTALDFALSYGRG